ncbi:response regulator [Rhodoplanes sp. Z2-YC6860]|uniref:response regulator n=1 Tax=Rhodoplanes sp. Z2-YC6860 TaxID=674703 RepID=UPI00078E14A6|nr:response regulator [Rhodoplanes sp. Z2-YC6860]AMN45321.1 pas/pac sensor hybrid histidine kinase [Rhodoplanes sp. Z2-YC6860]
MSENSRCVLLVEDEALVAMVAADALNELGFEVIEAASAKVALQLAENNKDRIGVALVDLGLPDLPGEQLVGELRALYPHLPIIVASGKGPGAIDPKWQSSNAVVILPKPYNFEDLQSIIARVVGDRPAD